MNLRWNIIFFVLFSCPVYSQIPSVPYSSDTSNIDLHKPGEGVSIYKGKFASANFSFYGQIRYLNQFYKNDTYTFNNGNQITLDPRNDIQFQKIMIYFNGFVHTPKFRYILYVWTSNTSLGLGAQVVVGGNLQYKINEYLDIGVGITGLPSTRSLHGQFPGWLRTDARPISEEFFRASFTTGIWAQGKIIDNLYYKAMLGNNLSQLGIDAGQLDDGFDTFSGLIYYATENFGRIARFGDFNYSEKPAFKISTAFTRSNETDQSQPGTEDPENSQIRLSDGRTLFSNGTFEQNILVTKAKYEMLSPHFAIKYHGFSLFSEFYFRWISNIEANGRIPYTEFEDNGFQVQASKMIIKKTLMLYGYYSKIYGNNGDPYDYGVGLNIYPFNNEVFRINPEFMYVKNSPVGYLSYPLLLGATGNTLMVTAEIRF
ncbi:hypothetical protein OO013_09925 [Mangrovivirga sp. M17]|uniref:Porin n=1 Tax=Mangrovivirga halotolerans TaxID=2993936 RepID=A0ABT3RQZ3_9BACT|nr:hypothetical protein [Mangrovivirga halotolerans]MCX2744184.1 hypothetical protein [Mangrovivirga halotolerans]